MWSQLHTVLSSDQGNNHKQIKAQIMHGICVTVPKHVYEEDVCQLGRRRYDDIMGWIPNGAGYQ